MKPATRQLAAIAAAAFAGMAGNFLLGPSPAAMAPVAAPESPWTAVAMRVPDLAAVDAGWEARAPWGRAPRPPEPEPEPPPPPPVPVGVVGTGATRQAIFMIHGAGELRVGAGGALPDGGRVLEVSALAVTWVDGAGQEHRRRMFVDPLQLAGESR